MAVVALAVAFLTSCQALPTSDIVVGERQATAAPRPQPSAFATQQPAPPIIEAPIVWAIIGAPIHLSIPKIGVDATIYRHTDEMIREYEETPGKVGISPAFPGQVAWWPGGGVPGGGVQDLSGDTAYLYGHTAPNTYAPEVFNRLKELVIGDTMLVTDENGEWLGCVVEEVFTISKAALSTDDRLLKSVPGRMWLIACWREFDEQLKTTENLVVQTSCGVL